MKIIIEKDYEAMSRTTANILLGEMYQNKRVNLSITAGTTPVKMYEYLVQDVKDKDYFGNVHYYNFDEVPYKGEGGYGAVLNALENSYFKPANINKENIHPINDTNYEVQDERVKRDGGLDLILLGIGADGHFCGNMPGTTKLENLTYRIDADATPETRAGLLHEVGGVESRCPDFYVTMGPKSVMQSRRIILFATGKSKAAIIKTAFFGPVTESIPSSILQLHPNITLVLDEEAASEIKDLVKQRPELY